YISHRLNEMEQIADRVVVLRAGGCVGSLARVEITHDRMVKMMDGRALDQFYQQPQAERLPGYFEIEELHTSRYPNQKVSFGVGKGEIVGLAGLVGAGRTEVAQALFGIDGTIEAKIKLDRKV